MAKSATAGEMRTRITVQQQTVGTDADGVSTKTWANVFAGSVWCKWAGSFGGDVLENKRVELGQTAVVTMRYTPLINQRCRIFHETDAQTDANAWEIIGINVPDDKRAFLELTLLRKVVA